MPWDSESAKEAQKKSVEVRRRRAAMSTEERVKLLAAGDSEAAMKDLIDAAHATGDFTDLDLAKRVNALTTVLAYGIGRPTASTSKAPETSDPEPEDVPLV